MFFSLAFGGRRALIFQVLYSGGKLFFFQKGAYFLSVLPLSCNPSDYVSSHAF